MGVDAVGMIFAPSKRRVDRRTAQQVAQALPPWVSRVGVFVDPSLDDLLGAIDAAKLDVVQLHVREDGPWSTDHVPLSALHRHLGSTKVVRAVRFADGVVPSTTMQPGVAAVLLDGPKAGSGVPFAWQDAVVWRGADRWMLAGGLHAGNVEEAIDVLEPPAVDVASGVESGPGIKDVARSKAFFEAVRRADDRRFSRTSIDTHSP